jgi:hypothetical protein
VKAKLEFAKVVRALNREAEFSPGAISETRRVEGLNGSETIFNIDPYWIQLRNTAVSYAPSHVSKGANPEDFIASDATYQRAQEVFVCTLHDFLERWLESERDFVKFFQRHPDIPLAIDGFFRRNPLSFIWTPDSFAVLPPIGPFPATHNIPHGKDKPVLRARDEAIGLIADLLRSRAVNRLAKCLRCGRYFFGRPGQKCCPRPRRCGSTLAAMEATKRRWKKARQDTLARVQAACAEWERRKPRDGWKLWVGRRAKVTSNWLTRAVNTKELTPPMADKGRNP